MPSSQVVPGQVGLALDDEGSMVSAGLLLPATLAERLGSSRSPTSVVNLGDQPGAAHPGRKLLTLVHALVAGGDCIDDVKLQRSGATASVLGRRVMATASTPAATIIAWRFMVLLYPSVSATDQPAARSCWNV